MGKVPPRGYGECMERTLPALLPGRLFLLTLPRPLSQELTHHLLAHLSLAGPVRVLEGGNAFAAFALSRLIRRQTPHLDEALARITLARAFTCYQVLALLAETPATASPCFVLNLLTTFYDESVAPAESERLLKLAMEHLLRLRTCAPVVVSVSPPPPKYAARAGLITRLESIADEIITAQPASNTRLQPRLFP